MIKKKKNRKGEIPYTIPCQLEKIPELEWNDETQVQRIPEGQQMFEKVGTIRLKSENEVKIPELPHPVMTMRKVDEQGNFLNCDTTWVCYHPCSVPLTTENVQKIKLLSKGIGRDQKDWIKAPRFRGVFS